MLGAQYMLPKCTKPVGGVSHTQHSVCCRKPNRTDVLYFWEKKCSTFPRIFPFFLLQRISLVLFTEKRWTIGIVVCFVFITVDDLLKSVGFFAFRDTTQEFTAKHSRYTLLFFKNRRQIKRKKKKNKTCFFLTAGGIGIPTSRYFSPFSDLMSLSNSCR